MTRILYLTPLAPLPTTDGGRQRTNLLYQALAKLGQVGTVVVNQTDHPISSQERERLSADYGLVDVLDFQRVGLRPPWSWSGRLGDQLAHLLAGWQVDYAPDPGVRRRVDELVSEYDLIVSRYLWAPAVAGVFGGRLPLIVDVDDRESERVRSSLDGHVDRSDWSAMKRWWWDRRIAQLATAERRLLSQCEHFLLTKKQDLQGIEQLKQWSLLPNIPFGIPDSPSEDPPSCDEPSLLFVGSLGFAPNRNGMQRFIDRSWPVVRAACPTAKLTVVGGSAPEAWGAVPGVELAGFVERLDQAYADAAFSIVPLWQGAGTKIKVLESLQRSRTVVASPYAMRGYEAHLLDGESVLVGEDDAGLAQACIRLLQEPALAKRLAECGATKVEGHYSQGVFDATVRETVERVLSEQAGEETASS